MPDERQVWYMHGWLHVVIQTYMYYIIICTYLYY